MIKLVTEQTAQPMYLALCDHKHCGVYARLPLPPGLDDKNGEVVLVQQLHKEGWKVRIHEILCPYHAGAPAKAMIELAKTIPGMLN